jgi:hypothetical protein
MRVQGALTALTQSLQQAALTVQLDLVETISKLIFKNQENQNEFRKIDGYSFFPKLFDTISDFSSREGQLFLEDCFGLLFAITVDGNKTKRVGNLDALELLFRVTLYSNYQVKLHALRCIQVPTPRVSPKKKLIAFLSFLISHSLFFSSSRAGHT